MHQLLRYRWQLPARPTVRLLLAATVLMAGVATTTAQVAVDGFMRGAGKTSASVSFSTESYDEYWQGTTLRSNPNLGTISTQSVGLYVAGGVTDYVDVVLSLPYITTKPSAGYWPQQSGLQDLGAAVKVRPLELEVPEGNLSVIAAGSITTPITKYVPDAPVAIGHYSTNFDSRLVLQYTADFGGFATLQGGYIHRSNVDLDRGYTVAVPDAVDVIGKVGYYTGPFYVDAWMQRQNAQSGTNLGPLASFPSNKQSYTKLGASAYYGLPWVENLGISVGFGTILDGINVGKATRISGGVSYGLPEWGGM
ncbi:MAG: hypothetical protein IT211_05725 [Armatimonadetes bacterium]|nr:hypothetical protein [Armatimonadota bacterium]